MTTIAVIDYGMGNLRSVAKALEHVAPRRRVVVTQDPRQIAEAAHVVFPGQGAIRDCMHELAAHGLVEAVCEAAASRPFLGLCLGPQALLDHSEENGGVDCLGVIAGQVRRFRAPFDSAGVPVCKIPHMGWNQVSQDLPHPLWEGIAQHSRFYFVHSYYLAPRDDSVVAGTSEYIHRFAAAIARANIFAVQFHPEKSAAAGLRLLENFSRWDP